MKKIKNKNKVIKPDELPTKQEIDFICGNEEERKVWYKFIKILNKLSKL